MNQPLRHQDTKIQHETISPRIIGAAIEVHRNLGPGLLEPLYESALCIELEERHVMFQRQVRLPTYYKGRLLGTYRVDLIVEDVVVVEVKCAAAMAGVFEAQLLTYLHITGKRIGLILNFNERLMKNGIRRMVL